MDHLIPSNPSLLRCFTPTTSHSLLSPLKYLIFICWEFSATSAEGRARFRGMDISFHWRSEQSSMFFRDKGSIMTFAGFWSVEMRDRKRLDMTRSDKNLCIQVREFSPFLLLFNPFLLCFCMLDSCCFLPATLPLPHPLYAYLFPPSLQNPFRKYPSTISSIKWFGISRMRPSPHFPFLDKNHAGRLEKKAGIPTRTLSFFPSKERDIGKGYRQTYMGVSVRKKNNGAFHVDI